MPQLNPSPWFMILCLSWFIFTTVVLPLILIHTVPNEAAAEDHPLVQKMTEPWAYPWED